MKSIQLFAPLLLLATAVHAQQVKFADPQPEAGKALSFTYNPSGTKLEKSAGIKCTAYSFYSGTPKESMVPLVKEGNVYKATVPTADSTTVVALSFTADEDQDENPEGYYVKLSHQGKIPAEAYANEAYILDQFGRYMLGMKANLSKGISAYDQAFGLKPALKNKSLYAYLSMRYRLDKEAGTKAINENIARIAQSKSTDEKDLSLVFNLYTLLNNKEAAATAKTELLKYYPTGSYAYMLAISPLRAEKDTKVLEEKVNALIKTFHLNAAKPADASKIDYLYGVLATSAAKDNNNAQFELYTSKIANKVARSSAYNAFAWPYAEKNENTAFAAEISKKSLELLVAAKADAVPSSYVSKEDYIKTLDNSYGMFADTYALLLYNQGKYKEAVNYEEKSFALSVNSSPDMNIRYVTYLKKDGQPEKAFTEAEKLIKEGKATDTVKNDFKVLYTQLGKPGNYTTYLSKLEEIAYAGEKAKYLKKMIDMPAPLFSLTSLTGAKVNLADLRGKTVIVDYWATWCGPCKASFPGMQMALDKYKNNPNVVFLFINTWERGENREKDVKDYLNTTKYTFNVLLDTKNKLDPTQFDTVSQYKVDGIPTKFIIDGKGNIRFKVVGFSGSAEGIVKELDMMIGMASSHDEIAKAK